MQHLTDCLKILRLHDPAQNEKTLKKLFGQRFSRLEAEKLGLKKHFIFFLAQVYVLPWLHILRYRWHYRMSEQIQCVRSVNQTVSVCGFLRELGATSGWEINDVCKRRANKPRISKFSWNEALCISASINLHLDEFKSRL
jgi:hypothetical protein